jgi:hypothetical protein
MTITYRLTEKEVNELMALHFVQPFELTSTPITLDRNVSIRMGKVWPAELIVKNDNFGLLGFFFRKNAGNCVYKPFRVFDDEEFVIIPAVTDAEFGIENGLDDRDLCSTVSTRKVRK